MKKLDYTSGFFLFCFSIVLFFAARSLPLMGPFGPSSGFFPKILSGVLALVSIMIIINAWWHGRNIKDIQKAPKILGPDKKKYFLYLSLFFAFSLLFAKLGYTLSMILFLGFIIKYVEKQSWKMTIGIVIISGMTSYFLFIKFLSIPLPEGILSSVISR